MLHRLRDASFGLRSRLRLGLRLGLAVGAVALGPAAAAQVRGPLTGRVVDAAGEPVAAAQLTLLSRAFGGEAERPGQSLAVATDGAGRFVVQLRAGEGYTVWAAQARQTGAGPEHRVSAPVEHVAVGQRPELVLGPWRRPPRVVVRPHGDAELADLRVEVVPDVAHAMPFGLLDGDLAPPVPRLRSALLQLPDRPPLVVPLTAVDGVLRADMPAFQPRRIQVRDPAGGPVRGARVILRQSLRPRQRPPMLFDVPTHLVETAIGRATDDGVLFERPRSRHELCAVADGCAPKAFALGREDATVTLGPPASLRITPPDTGLVLVRSSHMRGDYTGFARVATHPRTGVVELPLPCDPVESLVSPFGHGDGRVVRAGEVREPGFLRVPWSSGKTTPVALGGLRRVEVQVLGPDGAPAAGAVGAVLPAATPWLELHTNPVFTDAMGRFVCHVGPEQWAIVFWDGRNFGALDVPRAGAVEPAALLLRPAPTATVRVPTDPAVVEFARIVTTTKNPTALPLAERLRLLLANQGLWTLIQRGVEVGQVPLLDGHVQLVVRGHGVAGGPVTRDR